MSGPGPQEHSYLKVLHDFRYKTAEGREIVIKKNERLYLLQKTNADWWQVVRNLEQRSFYVPATYVREISKAQASSTRKNSEEDRDNIFEPPQDPSYKSMPRESSNAMRNVKKWLAGAIDSKPEPPKTLYGSEAYQKTEVVDDGPRGRAVDHQTKSLERDFRSGHSSDREEDASHGSPRSRDSVEYHENSTKINRLSTSPKSTGLQFRMEAALQDPFRRELESSLDRRNLGMKTGGKVGTRVRTRSTNSEGSQVNSESGEHRETSDRTDKEFFAKSDGRKLNLSVHEEPRRDSESSSGASRNSRSLDFEGNKFSLRRDRSVSPKPLYGRQMTIGGGATVYQDKSVTGDTSAASGDHKILNDKRRTWAVEELMSELTQMCKERVVNKKPAFQLKSTEIKANFDPLEKLTREIHEMNRLRIEGNIPEAEDTSISNSPVSPINICKIAINSENSTVAQLKSLEPQPEIDPEPKKRASMQSEPEPKPLKSPKSPKILDEYNEANILNDWRTAEGAMDTTTRSLSPDKQSPYQKRNSSVRPSAASAEEPCYSNVKVNAERVKLRPKLKIKMAEPGAELRLTPSLEKLASEIQFLPARRTSQSDEAKIASRSTPEDRDADLGPFDEGSKSDDSLERTVHRGILKRRLEYKGSFKTNREGIYLEREKFNEAMKKSEISGLRKSSTVHCATIPECYRRFRKNAEKFEPLVENSIAKRRSRSLSDLELLEANFDAGERKESVIPRIQKSKPVPLPRTKIPAVKTRQESSLEKSNARASTASNSRERASPRTIPEPRKLSRDKRDASQDEANSRALEHGLPPIYFLSDQFSNHFAANSGRNVNIESSTAVGFKTLLCASDSGSDNCLQSKELLSSSTGNLNDRGSLRVARKSNSSANFNDGNRATRESLSDEQILSSNASSEALHSYSESEVTATLDLSSQPSPVGRNEQDSFECAAISLPPGWSQKFDSDTGQICFLNEQGDKPPKMDDECCVMEEKSIFGRLYAEEKAEEGDGLSECNCETEAPESAWLPDGLRKKMSRSFESVRESRCYPVIDWLREIRLSCDLYDVGLPASSRPEGDSASNEERWTSEGSEDFDDVESLATDERANVTIDGSPCVDCDNRLDIGHETHLRPASNELAATLQAETGGEDDSCGNDESIAGNKRVTTAFCIFRGCYALGCAIDATESSNDACCFDMQPENGNFFAFKRSAEFSDLLYCPDDDSALRYCELFLKRRIDHSNDFRRSSSQSERNSQRDHEATNGDCECLQCASFEGNSLKIDDATLVTKLENNFSDFGAKAEQPNEAEWSSKANLAKTDDAPLATNLENNLLDFGAKAEHLDEAEWSSKTYLSKFNDAPLATNLENNLLNCGAKAEQLDEAEWSSKANLSKIDDAPRAINLEHSLLDFETNDEKMIEPEISFDELSCGDNLAERFDDFDGSDDVVRDTEPLGRHCDSFDGSEGNKCSDYRPLDFTILNRNLEGDCKATTMSVMHWVEAFNELNALKESAQSTERIPAESFDIFDVARENSSEQACKLCHERSSERSSARCADAGVDFDKSAGVNESLEEYRRRKGSVSSDIVAWRRNLWDDCTEEPGGQWFSASDVEGKIYFFEQNSNESSWVLPAVQAEKSLSISADGRNDKADANGSSTSEQKEGGSSRTSVLANPSAASREPVTKKPGPTSGDWPHLYDGNNMLFLKEGIINRTKITENGKKLRKNWSTSYAVLTELFLLFFKDAKTFTMMKTGQSSMAKPDISVDLNGALVEHGERASSRKNVYMISTVLGLQVLIQSDITAVATEWFQEVHGAIRKLPSGFKSQGKLASIAAEVRGNSSNKQSPEANQQEDPKKNSKIARSRSMKMKRLDDSLEDLSASAAERQTKIKAKLRWFFQRRPAVELLVKNGIYKDEPAFGSYLSDVCPTEPPRVPLFVKTCIEVLESKEENMKTDGLYRASGNLSQIQKIRLQVDQYKLDVLAQEEDVHVLAGALKLFFRELKEPLIPSTFFKEAVNASMLKKSSAKIQCFRDIVKALPPPNYDTLQFLLKHLLRVTSYQEFNRMHIPNLAIVFGPTLMWPAEESANMALDFMQQNLVIECLLSEYNKIFK